MPRLYRRGRTWWCWGYDDQGERWRASTHQTDKRVAEKVARKLELERSVPPDPTTAPVQLGEALLMLKTHKLRMNRAEGTLDKLRTKGGHLVRLFGGGKNVQAIRLQDTERYLDARTNEGAHPHTVLMELATLRQALNLLRRHGRYAGDTAALIPDGLENAYVPRERWLTEGEFRELITEGFPSRRDWIVAYCMTGLRYSELCGVTALDLNPDVRYLHVRGTKTAKSDRWIPLNADAWEVFSRRAKDAVPGNPIFPPWHKARLNQDMRKAAARLTRKRFEAAGLDERFATKAQLKALTFERVSTNDFRRTFASWLANRGVSEWQVVRLLGHGSSAMVRRVYAQLDVDTLKTAVDALPRIAVSGGVTDASRFGVA